MNVITKAVTAPFKLLAGLVGSDRDLENIAFAPGSAGIDERAALALGDLAGALTERPQLMLSVGGSADPEADGMALRRDRLERDLLDAGLSAESLAARDESWAEAIAARYAGLAVPEGDTATTGDESDEATAPSPERMYDALVAAVELEPRALQELGNARAAETKKHLVTEGGIAAERITIRFAAQSGDSAVHMEVQS
jgi:hypothetical protein